MKQKSNVLWVLIIAIVIGFIVVGLPPKNENHMATPQIKSGTPFTLTDHNGNPFNVSEKITDGHYGLIFFGFTHCPVICPTEMQKFAEIMDGLPSDIAAKITPVFITIDPERDTVEALQNFIPMFHPSLVGLTGDPDTVRRVLDDWHVYYAKVEDPEFNDYTMDHSTYSYLVDSKMKIIGLFRMNASSGDIIKQVSVIAAPNN